MKHLRSSRPAAAERKAMADKYSWEGQDRKALEAQLEGLRQTAETVQEFRFQTHFDLYSEEMRRIGEEQNALRAALQRCS